MTSDINSMQDVPRPKAWLEHVPIYTPGRSDVEGEAALAKLSSNENPLGPSPLAKAAYQQAIGELHRYPDGSTTTLRAKLAAVHGISADAIVCGNGSEELVGLAIQAFAGPGDEVVYCAKGFIGYPIGALRNGAKPIAALPSGDVTNLDAILAAITERTRIVCIANPNNPTGSWISGDDIDRFHARLPQNVVLMLDEAYAEYAPPESFRTALPLAAKAQNVIVTRTFSKAYALASLRLGWATASPVILSAIRRLMPAFSVSQPAQQAACAALDDTRWLARAVAHTALARDQLTQQLTGLGFNVAPSAANFLLVRFSSEKVASAVDRHLSAKGILVRALPIPGLRECLRMTIGLELENDMLVAALRDMKQQTGGF
jgi:histidinol-phosphate aminotransferase